VASPGRAWVLVRKGIERERKIREVEFMAGMAILKYFFTSKIFGVTT
jgi:hypothetical protein